MSGRNVYQNPKTNKNSSSRCTTNDYNSFATKTGYKNVNPLKKETMSVRIILYN